MTMIFALGCKIYPQSEKLNCSKGLSKIHKKFLNWLFYLPMYKIRELYFWFRS